MGTATKKDDPIFRSRFLDLLTLTHPVLIIGIYLPLSLGFLIWDYFYNHNSVLMGLGLFMGGLLLWTLAEYFLHRYLFHMFEHSEENSWKWKIHRLLHGYHHTHPTDKQRLFMPVLASFFMAALFLGIFYVVMREYAFSFFPGFVVGYLVYSSMHYSFHIFKFQNSYFNMMKTHHSLHHFKYPDKAFGVSNPLWDFIFGTMPPKMEKKKATRVTGK